MPALVLQPADVPRDFTRIESRRQGIADQPAAPRSAPDRSGRRAGWVARYRAPGRRGILTAQSRVDVFGEADGAHDDLLGARTQARATTRPARLGDEAYVSVLRRPGYPRPVLFITVAWRERNATASVAISGFAGQVHTADATALARRQARRLHGA
jgi:hypothetical protein